MQFHNFIHGGDWGVDDSLVVAMQSSLEYVPLAFVAGQGCATKDQVSKNIRALRKLFDLEEVPVISPRVFPYSEPPEKLSFFGRNGLNDMRLPVSVFEPLNSWVDVDLDRSKNFEWLETGPCTNLARLLNNNQSNLCNRISRIVVMGGCFSGNGIVGGLDPDILSPCAEFNFYLDAKAVEEVLRVAEKSKIDVVVVPWEECKKLLLPKAELNSVKAKGRQSQLMLNMTLKFFDLHKSDKVEGSDEPCYCPADVIAFCALMRKFGYEEEKHMKINTEQQSLFYGKSSLCEDRDKEAFPIRVFRLNEPENLKAFFYKALGWSLS